MLQLFLKEIGGRGVMGGSRDGGERVCLWKGVGKPSDDE